MLRKERRLPLGRQGRGSCLPEQLLLATVSEGFCVPPDLRISLGFGQEEPLQLCPAQNTLCLATVSRIQGCEVEHSEPLVFEVISAANVSKHRLF